MHNSNAYDFYFAYTLIVNSNSQLEKKFFLKQNALAYWHFL